MVNLETSNTISLQGSSSNTTPFSNDDESFDERGHFAPTTSSNTTTLVVMQDEKKGVETSGDAVEAMPAPIVAHWETFADTEMSPKLFGRLVELAGRGDGWLGPSSRGLSAEAVKAFLDFWTLVHRNAVEPPLALSPNGGIEAQWYASPKKHLDLHFRTDSKVFFGLFSGSSVVEGVDSAKSLAAFLIDYGTKPLSWKS